MSQINVAITGTGFMGTVHAEALRRVRGVQVRGIQGSTPDKSRRAAEQLELPIAYDSWEELVADPAVDAVHITTPNRLHFSQSVEALSAGKHVLCEKPLAMTAQESAKLVELANASGLICGVNYNIRFYPLNLDARQRVATGELGKLHSITGSYQQDWLLHDTDYNWRVLASQGGALRAISDIGTHWIDLVQWISKKKISAVFADLYTIHPIRKRPRGEVETFSGSKNPVVTTEEIEVTTDDMGSILLRFDDGSRGCVFVSQVSPGRKNCLRYEIAGSNSAIEWNSETPNQIWRGYRDQANQVMLKDPALMGDGTRQFSDYPGGHAEGFADTLKMCFRAFYDAIAHPVNELPPFATFEDGHREIQICDAVLRSASEQCWVQL